MVRRLCTVVDLNGLVSCGFCCCELFRLMRGGAWFTLFIDLPILFSKSEIRVSLELDDFGALSMTLILISQYLSHHVQVVF